MTAIDVSGRDGTAVTLTETDLDDLESRVSGPMLRAGDTGWDDAVLTWNGMVATTPALVVQPVTTDDVTSAVDFARDRGVLLTVKGGGHNIAGTCVAEGGLTIEMSRMREVGVDVDARLVHVGPGCLLKHVDTETQEHGLATVLGFVSETGVAGLTLGGGFGYLTRRFGYTVDNLVEVEIVTADGEVRTANRDEESDLFWAVRGGGGNYGVVTRFTFRLHEVGPTITGGLIAWSAERADEVLATYRKVTESAPRELTVACTMRLAPPAPFVPEEWHGKPIVAMVLCHSGGDPERDLEPVRALGDPIVDLITEKPYAAQQSMLDATQPKGLHYYWKTEFVPGLSDGFLKTFADGAFHIASPMSQSIMFHIGGALNEHADDDGAVGNRDAHYVTGFAGCWPADARAEDHIDRVRSAWESIRPFSTGGNYVNFQLADDDTDRIVDAYGANFARLQRLKAQFDPDNVFRVNRNITPG